ncbi:hypothetical protein FNF29_02158 [Cafeteria roenbergensis]|uniref:Uncharacterized protein n=1 Tax=Cafeteria roenbergensis TaxID=33653 RepID=A0A5A8CPK0_CAFRO|nr:hypothetical protein FNF29_02158 [Cafeteria roenbergensis]|eukprot:KAA0155015.1 hypothetical protein FNF29_02158 [Cafeteria roenbergensis]
MQRLMGLVRGATARGIQREGHVPAVALPAACTHSVHRPVAGMRLVPEATAREEAAAAERVLDQSPISGPKAGQAGVGLGFGPKTSRARADAWAAAKRAATVEVVEPGSVPRATQAAMPALAAQPSLTATLSSLAPGVREGLLVAFSLFRLRPVWQLSTLSAVVGGSTFFAYKPLLAALGISVTFGAFRGCVVRHGCDPAAPVGRRRSSSLHSLPESADAPAAPASPADLAAAMPPAGGRVCAAFQLLRRGGGLASEAARVASAVPLLAGGLSSLLSSAGQSRLSATAGQVPPCEGHGAEEGSASGASGRSSFASGASTGPEDFPRSRREARRRGVLVARVAEAVPGAMLGTAPTAISDQTARLVAKSQLTAAIADVAEPLLGVEPDALHPLAVGSDGQLSLSALVFGSAAASGLGADAHRGSSRALANTAVPSLFADWPKAERPSEAALQAAVRISQKRLRAIIAASHPDHIRETAARLGPLSWSGTEEGWLSVGARRMLSNHFRSQLAAAREVFAAAVHDAAGRGEEGWRSLVQRSSVAWNKAQIPQPLSREALVAAAQSSGPSPAKRRVEPRAEAHAARSSLGGASRSAKSGSSPASEAHTPAGSGRAAAASMSRLAAPPVVVPLPSAGSGSSMVDVGAALRAAEIAGGRPL